MNVVERVQQEKSDASGMSDAQKQNAGNKSNSENAESENGAEYKEGTEFGRVTGIGEEGEKEPKSEANGTGLVKDANEGNSTYSESQRQNVSRKEENIQPESVFQNSMVVGVIRGIRLAGMAAVGGCLVISNLRFRRKLLHNRSLIGREGRLKVYLTGQLESPCLCGIFCPAIYLTPASLKTEERKEHILLHEKTHYRHLDHIWTMVRSLCLVVYWFHPLVWVAAVLSIQDSELACDEGTFTLLGEEHRQDYGCTLIEMMADRSKAGQLFYCATGMVNGKKEIKKRITAIAGYHHYVIGVAALAVVLAVGLSACTFGAVGEEKETQEAEQGTEVDSSLNPEMNDSTVETDEKSDFNMTAEMKNEDNNSGQESQNSQDGESGALEKVDGRYRLSEYTIDLTQDKIKERICFDVWCSETVFEGKTVTEELHREYLWKSGMGMEIYVKILKGAEETENADSEEEIMLKEYSFAMAHAGNGNLAVVKYEKQNCILLYNNAMYQGIGDFWYQIWQFSPEGEIQLVKENRAEYYAPGNGENDEATVDQVLLVEKELNQLLRSSNTKILVNAAGEEKDCYLYSQADSSRVQYAYDTFMAEVGGSGLELKIKDYFYPDGLEPITQFPENAEEWVLNGGLLCMEVSQENTTAGRLDLDGDGKKEVLYLEGYSNFIGDGYSDRGNGEVYLDHYYRVRVNKTYYQDYCDWADFVLMAYSPDGKTILLAIYDDGPSADPQTYFFRYDGNSVIPAGMIPDDLRTMEIVEQGVLKGDSGQYMIQTDCIVGYWIWNGTEMVLREDEVYEFTRYKYLTDEYPTILLQQLTVYEERSEGSKAVVMKPQMVDIVRTDAKEWIYLEADDGTAGWFRVVDGKVPSLNNANIDEVIYGLSHAG